MIKIFYIPGLDYHGETCEQAEKREQKIAEATRKMLREWKESERQRATPMRSMQKWAEERGIFWHNVQSAGAEPAE